ncbi:MAG: ABC transporter ATP-binding protein, partial [Candidatus Methanomethylophilaceae archaeon]|nr:ABC transporter ATP-binding protein [Candidatus Methanomethylophilaceae archaeon]
LSKRLRRMEFEKVQSFSSKEMNVFSTPSLVTRSTNDITQVQFAVAMGMQVLMKAPIMAVYAITKILDKSWEWTAVTAASVVVIMAAIGLIMLYVIPRFKRIQWLTDDVNRVTRENITGIRVVRAYNAEKYQEDKSDAANRDLTDTNLSATRAMSTMMPVMSTILNILSLAIYWIGALLIDAASSPVDKLVLFSDMIVFSQYAMQVIMSFIMLVVIFMIIPRATVAARRIEEVIGTEPSITDGAGAEPPEKGTVSFENVSFRYPGSGEDAISGVTFDVKSGETVAFIGSTGSGKTTLVDLIPRFNDVSGGSVKVDGVDVRDYELGNLRKRIGYVSQKAFMFAGTVESNVNYGDTSDMRTGEDVGRALEIAQANGFVDDTGMSVSQGGSNFSGGQKQRISIARAVCRDPEIYIFDDSFSALDYKTDRTLRSNLKREIEGATILIVAQRIGTIMDADRIIVLDEGRVVGNGTHRELLRDCEVYREIARSQLSEEELGL